MPCCCLGWLLLLGVRLSCPAAPFRAPQAALGIKPKPGPHVVFVEKGGVKYAIGTLEAGRCSQFSCDITFAMDEVKLSHSGPSEVHLTGYRVEQVRRGCRRRRGWRGICCVALAGRGWHELRHAGALPVPCPPLYAPLLRAAAADLCGRQR